MSISHSTSPVGFPPLPTLAVLLHSSVVAVPFSFVAALAHLPASHPRAAHCHPRRIRPFFLLSSFPLYYSVPIRLILARRIRILLPSPLPRLCTLLYRLPSYSLIPI
ncbi:hypothetical protein DFH09DRAFT_1158201 [Mycena vulgaris]|nr:hypothetical protein DFH09DRAFT_1158201 [Mycena vulgaris]